MWAKQRIKRALIVLGDWYLPALSDWVQPNHVPRVSNKRKGQAVVGTWPKATAFIGAFRGRGIGDVWRGASVAAFKKKQTSVKFFVLILKKQRPR